MQDDRLHETAARSLSPIQGPASIFKVCLQSRLRLTAHFSNVESRNLSVFDLYEAQKCQSLHFQALKIVKWPVGRLLLPIKSSPRGLLRTYALLQYC